MPNGDKKKRYQKLKAKMSPAQKKDVSKAVRENAQEVAQQKMSRAVGSKIGGAVQSASTPKMMYKKTVRKINY